MDMIVVTVSVILLLKGGSIYKTFLLWAGLGRTAQGDGRPYQRHHPGDEGGHQACGQERYGGAAGGGERYRDQGLVGNCKRLMIKMHF